MSDAAQTPDLDALRAAHPGHWRRAAAIRTLTLDAVAAANSGHSGMPMGMADVATVLFEKHMKFDVSAPTWPGRRSHRSSGLPRMWGPCQPSTSTWRARWE